MALQNKPDWQRRRAAFNHDWLKNFLTSLRSFLNLLDEKIEAPALEQRLVSDVLPQWEAYRAEAFALAADFEAEMSPSALFERLPLARCDKSTEKWLSSLIDQLWRTRYPVRKWTEAAEARAAETDAAYAELQRALISCSDVALAVQLRPYRELFAQFTASCQALATAIETLPRRILVI